MCSVGSIRKQNAEYFKKYKKHREILNADVFFVNEGGQIHKHLMEAFDISMRYFTGISQPYG